MKTEDILYKQECNKWLNKKTGDVVYLDVGYDFGKHNQDWFKIPNGATIATYSNNDIRSDVILFWRGDEFRGNGGNCFDPNIQEKGWFASGAPNIYTFLTTGTYKGKIIWSVFK